MNTNRRKGDRRHYGRRPKFPIVDSDGNFVPQNRRRMVDRRYEDDPSALEQEGAAQDVQRLSLAYRHKRVIVAPDTQAFILGRHSSCNMVVKANAVSRQHACIVFRDACYYLVDSSTNGTFVKKDDGEVRQLQSSEIVLSEAGVISLGLSPDDDGAELIAFSLA